MKKINNKKILTRIRQDPSSWTLILTNLITLILAIIQKWNIGDLLWIYLIQSIIIGFFNVVKILSLKNFSATGYIIGDKEAKPTKKTKTFSALFFAFHYGLFHLIYALFLRDFLTLEFDKFLILKMSTLFFVNHLFSFFYNLKNDQKINIGKLMFLPYYRIIPMHLTIIGAGVLFIPASVLIGLFLVVTHLFFGTIDPTALLSIIGSMAGITLTIIFLVLKTLADVSAHIFEHTSGFKTTKKI